MSICRILVLNGPNLGHLGEREPQVYGTLGMRDLPSLVEQVMGDRAADVELIFYQANGQGQLIDRLELAREEKMDGVVFNAGAYTHTSLAIADCLAWIGLPCVEVHLSNIFARKDQPLRQQSLMGQNCLGVIAGFGLLSYALAVSAIWVHFSSKT